MSTIKVNNLQHPSAASPAIVLDAAGNATVAGMGLVLVKPTSIANSGGSASVSGGAVTFTDVSSISLNGVFTSAYSNYRIVITAKTTVSGDIDYRFRVAGVDDSTTNYGHQYLYANGTSVTGVKSTGLSSGFLFSAATSESIFVTDISSPNITVATSAIGQQKGGGPSLYVIGNSHNVASSFDGITLISASTTTGVIRVYGYQNS